MSSRRTMILLGAIAVGVIAALLLFQYIKGIEDRAFEKAKRVDVFIAQGQIKRGALGRDMVASSDIVQAQIPQQFRPETAINTTDEIAPKVALFDIAPGTVIVNGMFVDPVTNTISFRQRLKNQKRVAISVQTDPVHGVAGLLVPGDEVNLLVFDEPKAPQAGSSVAAGGQGETVGTGIEKPLFLLKSRARVLYQKVVIIAIGQSTKLEPGETVDPNKTTTAAANNNIITFEVPPEAALWIASAENGGGGAYFTLVGEDYQPTEIKPIPDVYEKFPGEDVAELTPYGPTGAEQK